MFSYDISDIIIMPNKVDHPKITYYNRIDDGNGHGEFSESHLVMFWLVALAILNVIIMFAYRVRIIVIELDCNMHVLVCLNCLVR